MIVALLAGCAGWVFDTRTHACIDPADNAATLPVCIESSGPLRLIDQGVNGSCRVETTGDRAPRRYPRGCLGTDELTDPDGMITLSDVSSARFVSLNDVDARWGAEGEYPDDLRGTFIELGSIGDDDLPQVEVRALGNSIGWLRWNKSDEFSELLLDCTACAVVLRGINVVDLTVRESSSHAIVCSGPGASLSVTPDGGLIELVGAPVTDRQPGAGAVVKHGGTTQLDIQQLENSREPRQCSF